MAIKASKLNQLWKLTLIQNAIEENHPDLYKQRRVSTHKNN